MISFAFTERDEEILEEARAQARLAAQIRARFRARRGQVAAARLSRSGGPARHQGAAARRTRPKRAAPRSSTPCSIWKIGAAACRCAKARYSLGNTVLKIAGTAGAICALGRQDHRHRPDRADRRLRSRLDRTTATWDAANREWVIEGEKIFITYAESCDAALVLARMVHPERRGLSTFMVEKGTPGFTVGRQLPQDGHTLRGHRGPRVLRLPRARLQPHRRRSEEDAAIILRIAARWSRPMRSASPARRWILPGSASPRSALRPTTTRSDRTQRRRRSDAGAGSRMGGDLGDGAARQMDRAERRPRQDRILGRQGDGRRARAQGDANLYRTAGRQRAF